MKKLKILMLGYSDSDTTGHVYGSYSKLPDCYDKRLVVFSTIKKNKTIAFIDESKKIERAKRRLIQWFQNMLRLLSTHKRLIINNDKSYCFYGNEYTIITAKQILNKHKFFKPDIISIHWTAGFLSSKTIKDLYEITKAKIVFVFVDEQHMTGGCHYPTDCKEYIKSCENCPAIIKGKKVAEIQLAKKEEHFKAIPKFVIASPYDCRLLKNSPIFKDSVSFHSISIPRMNHISPSEARKQFRINEDEFVVMVGANNLNDTRKGLKYSIEAIKTFAKYCPKLCVMVIGHNGPLLQLVGIQRVVYPGFLSFTQLSSAFCAADCFLSTTIADSGPLMVNYSIFQKTPVVSFNIGIAQDLVIHQKTGYIAKYQDFMDVCKGIEYIYTKGKKYFEGNCKSIIDYYIDKPSGFQQLFDYLNRA